MYRIHLLDLDSRITASQEVEARDSAQAIAIAEKLAVESRPTGCMGFEVWQGLRLLGSGFTGVH